MAKYAANGWEVSVLCATRGEAGRRGDYEKENLSTGGFGLVRQREMEEACRVLGVRKPLFMKCADGRVSKDYRNSAKAKIVRFLRKWKPDTVITFGPDGVSGHTDHVAIGGIATAAAREAGIRFLYYVLQSESLPTCCKPAVPVSSPPVTTVIDVGGFGERKLRAMRCYRSQKHLLAENPAVIRDTVNGREHFHRALPAGFTVGREDHLLEPFPERKDRTGKEGNAYG